MTDLIIKPERSELAATAAEILAESIEDVLNQKDFAVVGVVGGSSVAGVFESLKNERVDWPSVHVFMADERLVPIEDGESNYEVLKECLVDELVDLGEIPAENVHPLNYDETQGDNAQTSYAQELKRYGGAFDIVLLSAGEDGHVAGLFPNHHSIADESDYFITFDDSPKPPPQRVSASRKLLLRSKTALLLFVGESKREALTKFTSSNVDVNACPAKLVYSIRDSYALTDLELEVSL